MSRKMSRIIVTTGLSLSILAVGTAGTASAATSNNVKYIPPTSVEKKAVNVKETLNKFLSNESELYTKTVLESDERTKKVITDIVKKQRNLDLMSEKKILSLKKEGQNIIKIYDQRVQKEKIKLQKARTPLERQVIEERINQLKTERDKKIGELSSKIVLIEETTKLQNELYKNDIKNVSDVHNAKKSVFYDSLKRLTVFVNAWL